MTFCTRMFNNFTFPVTRGAGLLHGKKALLNAHLSIAAAIRTRLRRCAIPRTGTTAVTAAHHGWNGHFGGFAKNSFFQRNFQRKMQISATLWAAAFASAKNITEDITKDITEIHAISATPHSAKSTHAFHASMAKLIVGCALS